jgi:hypothetical protein
MDLFQVEQKLMKNGEPTGLFVILSRNRAARSAIDSDFDFESYSEYVKFCETEKPKNFALMRVLAN